MNRRLPITLPKNSNNEDFFKQYTYYIFNIAIKDFKKNALLIEEKKLSILLDDIEFINEILKNKNKISDESLKEHEIFLNLEILKTIFERKKIQLDKNIAHLNKEIFFKEEFIFDGPITLKTNEKYFNALKFIFPVILSLFIYLIYIIYRINKLN